MRQWSLLLATILIGLFVLIGCSGGGSNIPVTPGNGPELTNSPSDHNAQAQTHLWGYWDIYFDFENMTLEAVPNRHVMFTANLTKIMNKNPAALGFKFNGTTPGSGFIGVDLDLSITHPFAGLPAYNGYDVRGVLMGNGSGTFAYNTDCKYPVLGSDQMMMPDPVDGFGGPDGYTRWFNVSEFDGAMPLVSYHPGVAASKGFAGTATVNAYKYFADGLSKNANVYSWLTTHTSTRGVFSSGATNTRNYYIRFPLPAPGIKYGYAVIANWEGTSPADHPNNAKEALAVDVTDTSNLYYVDATSKGGSIIADITVFDWATHTPSPSMTDYKIILESPVLTAPYTFSTMEMTPVTPGINNTYTYHVEVPANNLTKSGQVPMWIIVQSELYNYTNKFGVPNDAGTDKLAAFFPYTLTVGTVAPCPTPVVNSSNPNVGSEGDILTGVLINCANLVNGPSLAVSLLNSPNMPIIGTNVVFVSATQVRCDFNLTGAAAGLWDIQVVNGCGTPGIGNDLFEVLGCTTPGVLSIAPDTAYPYSVITGATVGCTDLESGPSLAVKLSMDGQPDITGTNVVFVDSTSLTADFNIGSAAAGFWDVVVTNGCGGVPGVGSGLFEVEECPSPTVVSITPDSGTVDTTVNDAVITVDMLLIDGPMLSVFLQQGGNPSINGTDVNYINGTSFSADFNLAGAPLGLYSVFVTNGCGGLTGIGTNMFEVTAAASGIIVDANGALPSTLPYPDDKQFCVVGNNSKGYAGVYFFGPSYSIQYYPLDYSANSKTYMTIDGNYGIPQATFFGAPNELGAIEVDPTGGVIMNSHSTGILFGTYQRAQCSMWFEAAKPACSNALVLTSSYGTVWTQDVEADLDFYGNLWCKYGTSAVIDPSVAVVMNGVGYPYSSGSYSTGWGIDYGPLDTVGSVDGEISDMEAFRLAVDSEPKNLTAPLDIIFYYLEGSPDSPGIEVFANQVSMTGASATLLTTIDDVFVGTPVDISVLWTYGNIGSAAGNWLAVLEDNGGGTWQVALFDQNGNLIDRLDTPQSGNPLGIDCDNENTTMHVWADDGGTLEYTILSFAE